MWVDQKNHGTNLDKVCGAEVVKAMVDGFASNPETLVNYNPAAVKPKISKFCGYVYFGEVGARKMFEF